MKPANSPSRLPSCAACRGAVISSQENAQSVAQPLRGLFSVKMKAHLLPEVIPVLKAFHVPEVVH